MKITAKQLEAIQDCGRELATNFDIPARDIIAMHAAEAGVSVKAFQRMRDQQHKGEA